LVNVQGEFLSRRCGERPASEVRFAACRNFHPVVMVAAACGNGVLGYVDEACWAVASSFG
jgi:hypothetical protein